jgi:serine protease inhibitor
MIDLNETVDIGWLKEMLTVDEIGDSWKISQALQQTKFKMNETGAHVKSAVAIGVMRCVSFGRPPELHLVIDKPFLLWIAREGTSLPIFAAYLDEDVWKDPKNLTL